MSQLQQATQPVSAPVQAQAPASNPLDQLKDIHLPDQIDQFPIAIGWWILLALIISTVCYAIYVIFKYKKAIRLLKPAKTEILALQNLEQSEANGQAIATLSALLKRISLVYFPHKNIASLSGKAWLDFLNHQATKDNNFFTEGDIQLFSQAAYQKEPDIDLAEWKELLKASEECIESIITTAAKNSNRNIIINLTFNINKRGKQ